MRRGAKPAKAKAEARLPVAGKSRKNEGSRGRHLEKRLAEALKREAEAREQQTATAEILRVISSSPTDVQPVFAAVLRSAARLCDALDASIFQVDGDGLRLVAHEGPIPSHPVGEFPLIRGTTVGRAVLDRRTIHVPDVQAEVDEYPDASSFARSFGFRTTLSVPLLRGTEAIGAIAIRRTEVRPFTDRQIELLQTFAAQAVIAIENVRLFNETKEALEQQTATAEILRVIAQLADRRPAGLRRGRRERRAVCASDDSVVFRLEGSVLHLVARHGQSADARRRAARRSLSVTRTRIDRRRARCSTRRSMHIEDIRGRCRVPRRAETGARPGYRTCWPCRCSVRAQPIGVIVVRRRRSDRSPRSRSRSSRPSPTRRSSPSRTCGCSRSWRRATASCRGAGAADGHRRNPRGHRRSPTDLQPVLRRVVDERGRGCAAPIAAHLPARGRQFLRVVAITGPPAMVKRVCARRHPRRVERAPSAPCASSSGGRSTSSTSLADPGVPSYVEASAGRRHPHRAGRADAARGTAARRHLDRVRPEVRPFTDKQIDAAQDLRRPGGHRHRERPAVQGLEARNRELTESLEQQTATAEILRVIASSPTDLQPVMEAVAENAARVCGAMDSAIFRLEGEQSCAWWRGMDRCAEHDDRRNRSRSVATRWRTGGDRPADDPRRGHPGRRGEFPETVSRLRQGGSTIRTMLATPLLREGTPLGVIFINRGPEVQSLLGQADRAPRDVRQPGGDRDRERPAVHGAAGEEPR